MAKVNSLNSSKMPSKFHYQFDPSNRAFIGHTILIFQHLVPRCSFLERQRKSYKNSFLNDSMSNHPRFYSLQFQLIFYLEVDFFRVVKSSVLFDGHFDIFVVEYLTPVAFSNIFAFRFYLFPNQVWHRLNSAKG